MTTPAKQKRQTRPTFMARIKVFGHYYEASGKTVLEAINKLSPGNARGVAVLSVTKGKTTKDRVLAPIQTARLFNTKGLSRDVMLKNVSNLFAGL